MITEIRELEKLPVHICNSFLASKITHWYQLNKEPYPWRLMWEKTGNPYFVWISEIMLQQTVIKAVLPKYQNFIHIFPNVKSLSLAEEANIRPVIAGLGYYRRFRMMSEAAQFITRNSPQEIVWPKSFQDWKKLPGIGDYTAAAIASITLSEPVPVVDGNVERVMCRFLDIRLPPNLPKLKKLFFSYLSEMMDLENPGDFNQGMMELGQKLCRVSQPACGDCPIKSKCLSFKNKSQNLSPAAKNKKDFVNIELAILVERHQNYFHLYQRSSKSKFLKNTLGFKTYLKIGNKFILDGEKEDYDFDGSIPLGGFKHNITNHKIQVSVYETHIKKKKAANDEYFIPAIDIESKLISSLDRKIFSIIN